jgi:hypothetical protein
MGRDTRNVYECRLSEKNELCCVTYDLELDNIFILLWNMYEFDNLVKSPKRTLYEVIKYEPAR